jgi:hypothetical protein
VNAMRADSPCVCADSLWPCSSPPSPSAPQPARLSAPATRVAPSPVAHPAATPGNLAPVSPAGPCARLARFAATLGFDYRADIQRCDSRVAVRARDSIPSRPNVASIRRRSGSEHGARFAGRAATRRHRVQDHALRPPVQGRSAHFIEELRFSAFPCINSPWQRPTSCSVPPGLRRPRWRGRAARQKHPAHKFSSNATGS